MSNKTFHIGGIHPDKHKITTDKPIEDAGLPEIAYIPVKQHIGSPAKILVSKGDKVKVGTLLADADGVVSADVHSSVSGEVLKVEEIEGITIDVPNPNTIVVKGIDKQVVGQVAANIREKREPEPYKGKGIKYASERIIRKEGKAGGKK